MNQRGVSLIATYLAQRPLGRIVQVRNVGQDDYIVAIEDRRDGRTTLIHSVGDLRLWFDSFLRGDCVIPAVGICGRCDRLHIDHDVDGELLQNCIRCAGELIEVGAELFLRQHP